MMHYSFWQFFIQNILLPFPIFLVLAIGIFLMMTRVPQSTLRTLGILALVVLLGVQIVGGIIGLVEMVVFNLLANRGYSPYWVMNVIPIVIHLVHALGYGIVVWLLLKILKRPHTVSAAAGTSPTRPAA